MDKSSEVIRLCAVAQLHWVGWADEYVVFEESSGQTHHLDAFRAFVLNATLEGDASVKKLLEEITGVMAFESPQAADQVLSSVIKEFEALGLLERAFV